MKKFLAAICLITVVSSVEAQLPAFSIGPKIGYNSNTLSFNRDSISAGMRSAFQCGAFVRLGGKVYIQPEINYQVKGGVFEGEKLSASGLQKITLKTITVPVLIGIKVINSGPINLRLMAGPTMSFVIDKTLDPPSNSTLWPIHSVDDIKNSLWSLQMGGGIDVFFLTMDVRYEVGLNNMYTGSESFNLKNNIFNMSLGIKFL